LSYHLNESDAINASDDVVNISLNAGIDYTVYIRAENVLATDCFSICSFLIRMDNENTDIDDRMTAVCPSFQTL